MQNYLTNLNHFSLSVKLLSIYYKGSNGNKVMQLFWDTDALWPIKEKPIIMFIFVIII